MLVSALICLLFATCDNNSSDGNTDAKPIIILNRGAGQTSVDFNVSNETISKLEAYQSKEGTYYSKIEPKENDYNYFFLLNRSQQ